MMIEEAAARCAVLSDIDGNIWALEAVMADLCMRGCRYIMNLGDTVHGPLEPEATARRLMNMPALHIRGNQDRDIPESTAKKLTQRSIEWLASLPSTHRRGEELFLCHGTPRSDDEYLLEKIVDGAGQLKDEREILPCLEDVKEKVVLCGHSHTPRVVRLKDGRMIVNPGSVGLPAYRDETPVSHRMETGSPHARYAVIEKGSDGWKAVLIAVPYPFEEAVKKALENGREDWAKWLREGRAD
jgi:predicted phosphodiesterase